MKKLLFLLPLLLFTMFLQAQADESQAPKAEKESPSTTNTDDIIYRVVEEMPRFPGCEDKADKKERQSCAQKAMLTYMYKNLSYPPKAREHGVEGTVIVSVVIDENGKVTQPILERDIGGDCGAAALSIFQKMKDDNVIWIPGKQRGKAVKVKYTVPVKFKL